MELTQEHFDQQLGNLQNNINAQIQAQTKELKDYIYESFETQQEYIDERFHELFDDKLERTPAAVQNKASQENISLKPTNQSPYNRQKKK